MSDKLKILLITNNKLAVPAFQSLIAANVLCQVATSNKEHDIIHLYKEMATQAGIPFTLLRKDNYKSLIKDLITELKPDAVLVMTFPWLIPTEVLSIPKLGFINFHYGLLPEMRGADPIFESIRLSKPFAGVTVHIMDEKLDTGDILDMEKIPLSTEFTYGILSSQLSEVGNTICRRLIMELKKGRLPKSKKQDESIARYYPKVTEQDITIQWDKMTIEQIIALVRSGNPIAKGMPTTINNWKIGLVDVSTINIDGDASAIVPGTIIALDYQNGLCVCCLEGKGLKIDVIYTAEGIFPGYKLGFFGITPGMVFGQEPKIEQN